MTSFRFLSNNLDQVAQEAQFEQSRSAVYIFSYFEKCRGFSPYANFITANLITAVFQNFPKILPYAIFMYSWLMRFWG